MMSKRTVMRALQPATVFLIISALTTVCAAPKTAAAARTRPKVNAKKIAAPPAKATTAASAAPSAAQSGSTTVGGCPVFPADSAWNQEVRTLAVRGESARWLRTVNGTGDQNLHPDFASDPSIGIPYFVVPSSQRLFPVSFDEAPDESDPGPYPIPLNAPIEQGDDHHVIVVQQGSCRLYELYHGRPGKAGWVAGGGATFDLRTNGVRPKGWTSADAAGLAILPGLVRYDEVKAGVISHALRVTFPATQQAFIAPASHAAGTADSALPPMGARLRLRANVDLSGVTGDALVIVKAMQRYGLIVADNGSAWFVSGAPDSRWNDDDLAQLKKIPGTAFEFVENGPIEKA